MDILSIAIIVFLVLETSNVIMLYFTPGTLRGNGLGVFNAYEKSKKDPEIHALISYLVNWVAGTKIIFIALLIVILITGNTTTKLYSVMALIVTIFTYFWRLHPAIKKMASLNQITPSGYSKTLGKMIIGFMATFTIATIIYLLKSRIG